MIALWDCKARGRWQGWSSSNTTGSGFLVSDQEYKGKGREKYHGGYQPCASLRSAGHSHVSFSQLPADSRVSH